MSDPDPTASRNTAETGDRTRRLIVAAQALCASLAAPWQELRESRLDTADTIWRAAEAR
jgi:hypothetical protein